jgi:hypothetical protein
MQLVFESTAVSKELVLGPETLHAISVSHSAEADVAVRHRELQAIKHQCAQVYQQL